MLASHHARLRDEYDVIIVGSGYGGAISAARLGFANQRSGGKLSIAVLERGEEHVTGSFPKTEGQFFENIRHPQLNPLGLYDLLENPTVDVMQASALGGTSLINANVAAVPDQEVFASRWPSEIQREAEQGRWAPYYDRARWMLQPVPFAAETSLKKVSVFEKVSRVVSGRQEVLSLTVSREHRKTRYGLERNACISCGDCITGCNYGAKNTLVTNYLPMARHYGVEMFVRMEISHIEKRSSGGYRLVVWDRHSHPRGWHCRRRVVKARRVILAAGTLGTTGILLRSAAQGLSLSNKLGYGFSGNGDFFAVAYNTDDVTDITGTGARMLSEPGKAGPTITVGIRLNERDPDLRNRFFVEDLSAPSVLVNFLRHGFMFLALGKDRREALRSRRHFVRWLSDVVSSSTGAFNSSLGFLIMGHDDADGVLRLKADGSVTIDWPDAVCERIYGQMNEIMASAMPSIGGTYMVNPLTRFELLGRRLATAHPMGGCATGNHPDHGVVDHRGRVYQADGGIHQGLYVTDGSVIPGALGVNPFMTISAFTERMIEYIRSEMGLVGYDQTLERDDRLTSGT